MEFRLPAQAGVSFAIKRLFIAKPNAKPREIIQQSNFNGERTVSIYKINFKKILANLVPSLAPSLSLGLSLGIVFTRTRTIIVAGSILGATVANLILLSPPKEVFSFIPNAILGNENFIIEERLNINTSSRSDSLIFSDAVAKAQGFADTKSLGDEKSDNNQVANSPLLNNRPVMAVLDDSAILAHTWPIIPDLENRTEIITYEVQSGDTLSSIAVEFGINVKTIVWANKLKNDSLIWPGDKLEILPISGVKHTVSAKDTVSGLAKYYQAEDEDIVSFNNLTEDVKLALGQVLIIPGGKMPPPPAPKIKPKPKIQKETVVFDDGNTPDDLTGADHPPSHSHKFPWGQCTYYVASKRYVPWNGDAKNWLRNAKAYGFHISKEPRRGAIVITTENGRYGHAAYVEVVNGNSITISEMNYRGLGVKTVRTIPISSPVIRGYIH